MLDHNASKKATAVVFVLLAIALFSYVISYSVGWAFDYNYVSMGDSYYSFKFYMFAETILQHFSDFVAVVVCSLIAFLIFKKSDFSALTIPLVLLIFFLAACGFSGFANFVYYAMHEDSWFRETYPKDYNFMAWSGTFHIFFALSLVSILLSILSTKKQLPFANVLPILFWVFFALTVLSVLLLTFNFPPISENTETIDGAKIRSFMNTVCRMSYMSFYYISLPALFFLKRTIDTAA